MKTNRNNDVTIEKIYYLLFGNFISVSAENVLHKKTDLLLSLIPVTVVGIRERSGRVQKKKISCSPSGKS